MMSNSKPSKTTVLAIILGIAMNANASTISMINHTNSRVEVIVEPGKGTLIPNQTEVRQSLAPGEEKILTINQEAMNNAHSFSVTGKVTMISMYNKCQSLSIDKNYKIVFIKGNWKDVVCTYKQVY